MIDRFWCCCGRERLMKKSWPVLNNDISSYIVIGMSLFELQISSSNKDFTRH